VASILHTTLDGLGKIVSQITDALPPLPTIPGLSSNNGRPLLPNQLPTIPGIGQ